MNVKAIQAQMSKLAEAEEALSKLMDLQTDAQNEYDDKGDTGQETLDNKYPWLADFLALPLGDLQTEIQDVTGMDLEG